MKRQNTGMDLTQGHVLKNLITLSLPIMLSNFMQTFYNLTDAFWLGKLGANARNAVSVAGIAFPLVFFLSSFGFGFVVAGTSLISQYKGAGELHKLREVVGQFIDILAVFCVIFLSLSFIFLDQILVLLQVPPEIYTMARQYISIILTGIVFMFIFLSYQSFSHGLGDTVSPMRVQIISVGINIVIDPILIFGVGPVPRMETMGAAYGTLFSRVVAALLSVWYIRTRSRIIIPRMADLVPRKDMMRRILRISIPASLGQSMTSFGFLILQGFVNSFGTVVISVFSIGNRMTSFFMMPAMGISNALASIVGQNLGAGEVGRAVKSVKIAFRVIMVIMLAGCSVIFFFGAHLTRFFINDPAVIEIGKRMFRVTSLASLLFGVVFIFMGVFNGSGHTRPTMLLNIARLWFLRIPFVYLLSGKLLEIIPLHDGVIFGILTAIARPLAASPFDALWWSMVFSNLIIAILAYRIYRTGRWKTTQIHS